MKFKSFLIFLLVLLSVSLVNSAPYLITKICDEAKILAFTGVTDSAPEGCALRPDGTLVFFEYTSTGAGARSYLVYNPTTNIVSSLAGPTEILAAVTPYDPSLTTVNSMNGLVSDNTGNIYTIVQMNPGYYEYVIKITPAGVVSVVVPASQGGDNLQDIEIDNASNMLYFVSDDYYNDPPVQPWGIHKISATTTNGTLDASTLVISQADMAAALNPAPADPKSINIYSIAYRPLTNDIIAADSTATADSDDFIKITLSPTPSASLFIDNTTVEGVTGVNSEIYRVDIAILNDGSLLCTSDSSGGLEGIFKINSTGTTATLEANESTILSYVGGTDWDTYYGRSIATDGVNVYVANAGEGGVAGGEGIVKFTYEPPTSVPKTVWEIYQ